MGQAHVSKKIRIEAPIELIFERLVDHDAMGDWPGVTSCRLVQEGTPRNGLGGEKPTFPPSNRGRLMKVAASMICV